MKPTEAYSRRTSRSNSIHNESDSAELRKRYPHWYQENDRDDRERRDSDDRKSPEYRRKSPSPERDYSDRRESSRDRQSPEYGRKSHYPHRDYREKSPSPERDYRERRESFERKSPEYRRKSSSQERDYRDRRDSGDRKSPDLRRRSPSPVRDYKERRDSGDRKSPEYRRKSQSPERDEFRSDERKESAKKFDYGRRSSTESFQTIKIRKSDLDEIRRKYTTKNKYETRPGKKIQRY